MALGRLAAAALDEAGEAALDLQPIEKDAMRASGTDEPDVGTQPHHGPLVAAARMWLAQPQAVPHPQIEGRRAHVAASAPSAAVAPVKLKLPRWSAGTRYPPKNSPASSFVSVPMPRTLLKASG